MKKIDLAFVSNHIFVSLRRSSDFNDMKNY